MEGYVHMADNRGMQSTLLDDDVTNVATWRSSAPDIETAANFVAGPGIQRLALRFDITAMRDALQSALRRINYQGNMQEQGFAAIPLTRRPGDHKVSDNDLSGRYWLRPDYRYLEEAREDVVDEAAFTELDSVFGDTYFAHVHAELCARFRIGRMRILSKGLYNCNSWHRDPEPRLHIPIITNPGSLFVVNHHCTHLPADGSVYFTDTRNYHTALNGGLYHRVHIVAALPP